MAIVVDPRFRAGDGDQADSGGSILRDIAARTPGVDYHPPTGELGSYGRGPLGEPTFQPYHPAYVDWLVKNAREADSGGRPADGRFQVAQSEAPADDVRKYYRDFHLKQPVVPPPLPPYVKTRQQLLDQAAGDEAWAKQLNQTADALERGSDGLYDLDPDQRDYLDDHGGQLTTEIDGAIVTGGWPGKPPSSSPSAPNARGPRPPRRPSDFATPRREATVQSLNRFCFVLSSSNLCTGRGEMDADDLTRAPERGKAPLGRLRKLSVFGALCAFATLAAACAPAGSKPARPPASNALLADFTRYCLDTHAERESAIAAAKRAGLKVQAIAPSANRAGIPVTVWIHPDKDMSVAMGVAGQEKGSDGVVQAMTCQASAIEDGGASLKALDDWLGPGHRLKAAGAVHEFQLRDGRAWPIDGDDPKAVAASRATGNHYVLVALHLKGLTTLTLRRWRGPAATGQATSIPPARSASASGSKPSP